jgi:phenylalanine-4-hydroxylase
MAIELDKEFARAQHMPKGSKYRAKIPDADGTIHYSEEEHARWGQLYRAQIDNVYRYAAPECIAGLNKLQLPSRRIPQCQEVSAILLELTGWRVAPVPALIDFKQFYTMLAERVFPAASFIRDRTDFKYVQEPDIFHEIFGHTPLLTDARFAAFSHAIGVVGQQADPKDYSWLARLYWFTIEFGITMSKGRHKPLGAGLISSPSELLYAATSDTPTRRGFDLLDVLRTPYRIDIHQPIYFVMENLDDLFQLAEYDLLAAVHQAQSLGLFAPSYAPRRGDTHLKQAV